MSFYAMTRVRRFFHVKSSGSGGQSKQKDAHDDMPGEGRQDRARQDSFKAEEAQIRGENRRQEAFDRKSADFKSIFVTNQRRRKRLYRKADILREEIFQNNDNKREAVFQAGQASRAAMYEKEETARVQFFEWFCETRAWILIEGRRTREKSFNDIDATIRDRCECLLQAQEDRFLQKERQRDTIVENLFAAQTPLKPNLSSDGFLESASWASTPRPSSSPVFEYMQTPIVRSIHSSSIPSEILSATEERRSSRSPLPIDISPLDARQQDNIPELEKEFGVSQRRHSEDFVHEEEMQSAESERDRAESERSRIFEKQELQRQDTFQVMLKMQENHYLSREETRADAADQREESFLISQDRHEQAFNMSIDNIGKRIQIEDSLEEFLDKKSRHRVEVTVTQQNDRFKAAADDQQTRFYTVQLRRRTQLGVTPPCPDLNQEPGMELPSCTRGYGRRCRRQPDLAEFHSPPTGFAIDTLFKGADTSNPLPIPNTEVAVQPEIGLDSGFETEWRHHASSVNEQRRALYFEQKQSSRQAIFEENEDKRERSFTEAQHQQEMRFLDAERLRGVSFRESERHRQRRFEVVQEARLQKLHGTLQELQTELFVEEERRLGDLKIWSTRLLEECEKQGKDRFQADEAERDKSFRSMLSAACHNDIG